jgi:hypothetical protein
MPPPPPDAGPLPPPPDAGFVDSGVWPDATVAPLIDAGADAPDSGTTTTPNNSGGDGADAHHASGSCSCGVSDRHAYATLDPLLLALAIGAIVARRRRPAR